MAEEGTNLASGASDGNPDRGLLEIDGSSREVSAELLNAGDEDRLVHL